MSKAIKLDDNTYADLEAIRLKRETFSQAVARLLFVYDAMVDVTSSAIHPTSDKRAQLGAETEVKEVPHEGRNSLEGLR